MEDQRNNEAAFGEGGLLNTKLFVFWTFFWYRKYSGKVVLHNMNFTNTNLELHNTLYILLLRVNTQFQKDLICSERLCNMPTLFQIL